MKNKTFSSHKEASLYFNTVSQNHDAFLIYNYEDSCYEVINQDLFDHYQNEFGLHMELIDCNC